MKTATMFTRPPTTALLVVLAAFWGCVASDYQQGENLMRIGEFDRAV